MAMESDSSSPKKDDAGTLILTQLQQVFQAQLGSLRSITEREGTVLSVLIGSVTVAITLAGAVSHPPLVDVAIPAGLLLASVVVAGYVFIGGETWSGPAPESLTQLASDPESKVTAQLIEFYKALIEDLRAPIERRAWVFRISVGLLMATVFALVISAIVVYSP
jgi:hypothetical protein